MMANVAMALLVLYLLLGEPETALKLLDDSEEAADDDDRREQREVGPSRMT